MLGAIADNIKSKDLPLFGEGSFFTDDTVLTVALADSILSDRPYTDLLHEYYHRYPRMSYGARFRAWAKLGDREPYNSCGNGSAERVSRWPGHVMSSKRTTRGSLEALLKRPCLIGSASVVSNQEGLRLRC